MRDMCVVYLIDEEKKQISLGLKKTKIGKGKLVGCGGKIEQDETMYECAFRETFEEFRVKCNNLVECGVLNINKNQEDYKCYIFKCNQWVGVPTKSQKIEPKWFDLHNPPFDKMMAPDKEWFNDFLEGKYVDVNIYFGEDYSTYKLINNA